MASGISKVAAVRKLTKDDGETKKPIKAVLENQEKWKTALSERGFSQTGRLLKSEAQLPIEEEAARKEKQRRGRRGEQGHWRRP